MYHISSLIVGQIFRQPTLIIFLLLGGWLGSTVESTPVLAQRLPDIQSPTLYIAQSEFTQSYLVIVDSNNSQLLEQIRQIEPSAFIRNLGQYSVIQAGVFTQEDNAQRRVQQLASYGINNIRIFNLTTGEEVAISNPRNNSNGQSSRSRSKFYYVVIPAEITELANIENRIRQNASANLQLASRTSPRGPHVAVGPFSDRFEAQRWNNYLRSSLGLSNARVYYGK